MSARKSNQEAQSRSRCVDARDPVVARQLLAHLIAAGTIEPAAADRAAQAQRETSERIDTVLLQLGLLSEGALLKSLADFFDLPLVDEQSTQVVPVLLPTVTIAFLRTNRLLPMAETSDTISLAIADAFSADILATLSYVTRRQIQAHLASGRWIDGELARLHDDTAAAIVVAEGSSERAAIEDDVQRLRDIASEAPIIRLVNRIITSAVEQGASDIHLEPLVDGLRVRHRVDGLLAEIERLPLDLLSGLASRIKILARLNIAERRLPQDGRAKFVVAGRELDLRVSTTPVLHGESIVMRILDREAISLDFTAMGFDAGQQADLGRLLGLSNGMILVTGPTGSGKTTTLYGALAQLNSIDRKVFTVEDPIEYQLPGVNQVQIKPAIGLDFVHCLRSILRQDPDVIMIGEMRDTETARTGIQSSLTGHLVLSTLHTNSAAASITRLLDMGVEGYLLASTIAGILAQRLVRCLCRACRRPAGPDILAALEPAHRTFVAKLGAISPYAAVGCATCRYTGYRGRTTIAELLMVDQDIRSRIVLGVTDRDIEAIARARGMETLFENGLRRAMTGVTTIEEVQRVARA